MVRSESKNIRCTYRFRICMAIGLLIFIFQILFWILFSIWFDDSAGTPSMEMDPKFSRQSIDGGDDVSSLVSSNEVVFGNSECRVTGREATSAISRAKSMICKQLLLNTTCRLQNGQLFPTELPHSCPTQGKNGKFLGCFRDNGDNRILKSAYYNFSKLNSQSYCIDKCLQAGYPYAGVQFGEECFCGNEEPAPEFHTADWSCNFKCPADVKQACGGYYKMNVYETGIANLDLLEYRPSIRNEIGYSIYIILMDQMIEIGAKKYCFLFSKYSKSCIWATEFTPQTANGVVLDDAEAPVRIVFLLTLNGRSVRQILRLIKILFHKDHFFFIHVDKRQDYMFRELEPLELRLENVRLSRRRLSAIWGGASLLTMLRQSMLELVNSSWDWDFLINLSESDYPIKSHSLLTTFLTSNKDHNFVRSHGRDLQHFIKKQGLDKTFVECEERMWRIGDKALPRGIVVDGGSDWVALSRSFVDYVVTSERNTLLDGLDIIFQHTLLPAESYFHTVLRNTPFCDKYINNNLHVTNWKRQRGCKCQYRHVVDWCGCSPNAFTMEDWPKIQLTRNKQVFFARKFDSTVSQSVINNVEEWLYGPYKGDINQNQFWLNIYHHLDGSPVADEALVAVCSSLCSYAFSSNLTNDLTSMHDKLLQVHLYSENDENKGILVNFESLICDNLFELEAWFQSSPAYELFEFDDLSSRITYLKVNTEYDIKEQIFRNYVGAIGPSSELTMLCRFVSGSTAYNISVLWIDPHWIVADVGFVSIDTNYGIQYLKSNLKTPLKAGIWNVYLVHDEQIIARVHFSVIPSKDMFSSILNNDNKSQSTYPISQDEWKDIVHSIRQRKLYDSKFDELNENVMRLNDSSLQHWVDSLVTIYYKPREICLVKGDTQKSSRCKVNLSNSCLTSHWSSFSPDLKTHIKSVNKTTGRLDR